MKKQKIFGMILSIVSVFLLIGCAKGDSEALFKAGTYTTEAEGYGVVQEVDTKFTEIENIEVLDNSETAGIGSTAIEKLPAEIVESQSLGVDTISGATITSEAILDAVSKAVEEAGGDVESLKNTSNSDTDKEAVKMETDVVVIGGGGAGLAAAVSAADNGAEVILVEKTAALGG